MWAFSSIQFNSIQTEPNYSLQTCRFITLYTLLAFALNCEVFSAVRSWYGHQVLNIFLCWVIVSLSLSLSLSPSLCGRWGKEEGKRQRERIMAEYWDRTPQMLAIFQQMFEESCCLSYSTLKQNVIWILLFDIRWCREDKTYMQTSITILINMPIFIYCMCLVGWGTWD